MPRDKHGHYDPERHLPDNTGQPQGSGLIVWLHEQVRQYWPEMLIEPCINARLLAELQTMQDDRATAIYNEYVRRRRAVQAEQRQRDRKISLARYQKQLETETNPGRLVFIRKEIAKLERSIAKAETEGDSDD